MAKEVYISLPVADLVRSERFYRAIGFTKVDDYSHDDGTVMRFADDFYIMLLRRDFYRTFIGQRTIPDAHEASLAMIALFVDSNEELDDLVSKAVANGATLMPKLAIDGTQGMHVIDFTDPDGHILELAHMEV